MSTKGSVQEPEWSSTVTASRQLAGSKSSLSGEFHSSRPPDVCLNDGAVRWVVDCRSSFKGHAGQLLNPLDFFVCYCFFWFFFLQFKPTFNQDIGLALNVVLPSTINTLWMPCEYRRMVLKRFLGIWIAELFPTRQTELIDDVGFQTVRKFFKLDCVESNLKWSWRKTTSDVDHKKI